MRVGGRYRDVEVENDAQPVLEHQHDQRRHADAPQPGPPRPPDVPSLGSVFVKTASHET